MNTPRISTCAYVADITFLDGSKRSVDHDLLVSSGAGITLSDKDGNNTLFVNPAAVQTIEVIKAAPLGTAQ